MFYRFKFTIERRNKVRITLLAGLVKPGTKAEERVWTFGNAPCLGWQGNCYQPANRWNTHLRGRELSRSQWEAVPMVSQANGLGYGAGFLMKGRRWERWRRLRDPPGGSGGGGARGLGTGPGFCSFSFCWGLGQGRCMSGQVKRWST